jgi:Zn-dependent metalloprotease
MVLVGNLQAVTVSELRSSGARVVHNELTDVSRFVGFDQAALASQPPAAALQRTSAQASALAHLASYGSLFGLQDAAKETRLQKHRDAKDGQAMTRYQQMYQGLPVIGGELIINQTAQRKLSSISGKISPKLKLAVTPSVSAVAAKALALQAMGKWYSKPASDFVVPEPTLSVYDPRLIVLQQLPVSLVWKLEVTTVRSLPIKEFILVDAVTGAIPLHFNQMAHAKNRVTKDANRTDPDTGTLTVVCTESNPTCTGAAPDAVKAHVYAGNTYDYYANVLGRDSIDDSGMSLISVVRACPFGESCPYSNAYWDGAKMVYGDGFSVAEDVVAHELTHGVTESESNLVYAYQSGAINESLSDVFGEFVQLSNAVEPVSNANRWKLGENLAGIGPFRSMSDPTIYGDPDRMGSPYFYTGSGDNGGVHINSGVNNKAAYLMVDGGTFNGRTVTAIGMAKTARIYYLAQTNLLTFSSDYLDLYNALNQSCQTLVGTGSPAVTTSDCVSVQNATQAVEMNTVRYGPSANTCAAGQFVSSMAFSEGFESGASRWAFAHTVGLYDWSVSASGANTGSYSVWGRDADARTDMTMTMSSGVTLPSNSSLWFAHKFDFEYSGGIRWDGGLLEYSANGGAWTAANSLWAEGQGYVGALDAGNPLGNQIPAFAGSSAGRVSTRYNLASLAGQSVRFRWRVGSDDYVGSPGWFVDDIQIYSCATPPGAPTGVSAQSFPGRVEVSFTPPVYSGSITGYTVSCSASGQTTRTASGSNSPISVNGLTQGVAYSCSVTANSGAVAGAASAAVSATSSRSVDITPILMLLLD